MSPSPTCLFSNQIVLCGSKGEQHGAERAVGWLKTYIRLPRMTTARCVERRRALSRSRHAHGALRSASASRLLISIFDKTAQHGKITRRRWRRRRRRKAYRLTCRHQGMARCRRAGHCALSRYLYATPSCALGTATLAHKPGVKHTPHALDCCRHTAEGQKEEGGRGRRRQAGRRRGEGVYLNRWDALGHLF